MLVTDSVVPSSTSVALASDVERWWSASSSRLPLTAGGDRRVVGAGDGPDTDAGVEVHAVGNRVGHETVIGCSFSARYWKAASVGSSVKLCVAAL